MKHVQDFDSGPYVFLTQCIDERLESRNDNAAKTTMNIIYKTCVDLCTVHQFVNVRGVFLST